MSKYIKVFLIATLLFGSSLLAYAQGNDNKGQNGTPPTKPQGEMMQNGQGGQQGGPQGQGGQMGNQKPMIMGTVTDIDNDTITIESKQFTPKDVKDTTTTKTEKTVTYTVDVSNATFYEDNETAELSDIEVGNKIMIEGTVSDTTKVTATKVHIGDFSGLKDETASGISTGTGEPVVMGKVTDIDESDGKIEIANNNSVTYEIDLSDAKITKDGKTITISDISEDDVVLVQGTIDGNDVTASSLSVQSEKGNSQSNDDNNLNGQKTGFFHKIGNFFSKFFGF
jgi:hypothetical protein